MSDTERRISVGNGEFRIDGRVEQLYGGAVHYWRLEREQWDGILQSVLDLGFTMISVHIPWEAHELERGVFDFGERDARTDIDAFLTLCEQKGFRIFVCPGPQINSELTWFGYPKRILADAELHAMSAQGSKSIITQVPKPIPALSYAVDKLFDEVALWFDAICPILAKHAINNGGGIVAAQVDNEMAFFLGINAYSGDFSPASLAAYRSFLERKYGSLEAVSAAHCTAYTAASEIEPPRRFEATDKCQVPSYVDWVEYREHYLVDSMDRLASMMRERGLDQIALFHNYPHPLGSGGAASGFTTPFNIPLLESKLDFVGFDIHARKHLYNQVKTVGSYMVGTSRYPYVPELIAGVWPWCLMPGQDYEEEFITKAALMQGLKGFSRYMLVERDRWLDSPIRRDGSLREKAGMYAHANRMQKEASFSSLRREAEVLLLANREYDRLEAAAVLVSFPGDFLETPSTSSEYPNPLTLAEDALGFSRPIQVEKSAWFTGLNDALYASGAGYVLSDTDLNPQRWAQYKVLVVATFDYLSAATQAALVNYVKAGGVLMVGPELPTLDSLMQPCTILADAAKAGVGRIVVIENLSGAAALMDRQLDVVGVSRVAKSVASIDVVVHRDLVDAARRVAFICNPVDEGVNARVGLGVQIVAADDLWADREIPLDGGELFLDLPPHSITIANLTVRA